MIIKTEDLILITVMLDCQHPVAAIREDHFISFQGVSHSVGLSLQLYCPWLHIPKISISSYLSSPPIIYHFQIPAKYEAVETFYVHVKRWGQRYQVTIETTYRSDNVIRFKITGGKKKILAEKWLFRKRNQWKITDRNFHDHGTPKEKKESDEILAEIIQGIELHLNPPKPRSTHPKNIGWKDWES